MATRVGVARGLAGCSPAMDNLAAELGLRLQCMGCTLQAEHLRGTLNVDADALRRLTQGSSVPVCLQHVLRVHPLVRDDSWCWARPKLRRFRHLRVTSHVNALFCLHSTTSHQLSSENCCFAVLSVQIMWSARQSQDEGASAVPLTSRLWCHRQGSLLPLHELASLPQADEPWTPNSPVGPKDTSLIAIWWLLQEIEAAAIICEDVSIGIVRRRTTLLLPCSKQDAQEKGAQRTHGGSCAASAGPACPFHAVVRQQGRVVALAAKLHMSSALLPLFPSSRCDCDTASSPSRRSPWQPTFRHSWRGSGAQAFAAAGVPAHVVAAMARWGKPTVRRYMAEAHLASSCNLASALRSARSTRNILPDLSVATAQIEVDVVLLRAELANLGADLAWEAANLQSAIRLAESTDNPALPVNDATWIEHFRSRVMHIACTYGIGAPAITWRSRFVGDSRRRRFASGLLGDEMPGGFPAASKVHRLGKQ